MGNGCCSEDRHYQQSLPENAKLQTIVSVIKDVESTLPKLEKETNRTLQTLTYLSTESTTVSSLLPPVDPSIKRLREEVSGYQSDIQHLLFKGSGRDQALPRGPRKRTIVRSKTSNLDHPDRDSGGKETADGLVDIELTFKALEIAYTEVKDTGDRLRAMKTRLNKAKNQLEINVYDSIQTLSTEINNLIGAKEDVLQEGILHDDAISHLAQISKPSVVHQRLLTLQKELESMRENVKTIGNRAETDLKEIEQREKEVNELEMFAFELVAELRDSLGSSPPSIPVENKGKTTPGEGKKNGEDYYKSKFEELSSILTSEEGKLQTAANNLSKMREKLENSQGEMKSVKAKVLLYVGKLRETRILLRFVRVWRVGVEKVKLDEAETRYSTDEIRYQKLENRRKFTRLVKVLNKHHEFVKERFFQRLKETHIRLSYNSSGRKSAVNPNKLLEIQIKSLVLSVQKCKNRVFRSVLWRLRSISKAKRAVFRLKTILLRLVRYQLNGGIAKLRLAKGTTAIEDVVSDEGVGLDLEGEKGTMGSVPEFEVRLFKQEMEDSREERREDRRDSPFEPASEDDIEPPIPPVSQGNLPFLLSSKSISEADFRSSSHSENVPSEDSVIEENLDEGRRRLNIQGQSTRLGSVPFSRLSYHP